MTYFLVVFELISLTLSKNLPEELMRDNVLQVRSAFVNFFVLRDVSGLYLVDAGFISGRKRLKRELSKQGWADLPILGIILTHGHLDHILNVKNLAKESGAWIAAPKNDQCHYQGAPRYSGSARVAGILEFFGRLMLRYQPFVPDRLLDDGDELEVCSGLKVVALPGHTKGHCALYSEQHKLLFSGDLFASFGRFSHFPPRIFNYDTEQVKKSVKAALCLDLVGVFPNHGDRSSPEIHLDRLRALDRKWL